MTLKGGGKCLSPQLCALIPPIAMTLVLVTLSMSVTQQPVALVVQGNGTASMHMAQIIRADTEAYDLTVTNATTANSMLENEQVAAVITIPSTFDQQVANGTGKVLLKINNVDFDFSDDIRRSVDRSVVEFDAPSLRVGRIRKYVPAQCVSCILKRAIH